MSLIEPPPRSAMLEFHRTGDAVPRTVVEWRAEFSHWLRSEFALDDDRLSDIVLAVDEALSNAAEFAYGGAAAGSMDLLARFASDDGTLHVTVSDAGSWHHREEHTRSLARGRGIPLMRALADSFTLEPSAEGTRVQLAFGGCPPAATDGPRQFDV
jgi:serine/threonine-protein kinase RsbW